jgi:Kef-type K+ transport system membrane component KefB
VYPPINARQQLGKNDAAVMSTHAAVEELLGHIFYAVCVISNESRQLVLPRTSCLSVIIIIIIIIIFYFNSVYIRYHVLRTFRINVSLAIFLTV